jgi:hypothetical protein
MKTIWDAFNDAAAKTAVAIKLEAEELEKMIETEYASVKEHPTCQALLPTVRTGLGAVCVSTRRYV